MPSGSGSPERARADVLADEYARNAKERDLNDARLEMRAELHSVTDEDELSGVVEQALLEAQAKGRLKAPEASIAPERVTIWNITYAAVKRMPPVGIPVVIVALIAAYTLLRLKGVIHWP